MFREIESHILKIVSGRHVVPRCDIHRTFLRFLLNLTNFDNFLLGDSIGEFVLELAGFIGDLLRFEVVDHVIDDVGGIFVDYFDHHFAENGVYVSVDVL